MSHQRSDRINLAPTEPRCEPSSTCFMKNRCARFQASIPQGAPLTDYSTGSAGGTAICDGYVAVGNFGPKAPMRAPVKPAVKGIA